MNHPRTLGDGPISEVREDWQSSHSLCLQRLSGMERSMPSELPPVSPHLGVIRTLQRPRREFVTVSAPPAARSPGPATAVAAPRVV